MFRRTLAPGSTSFLLREVVGWSPFGQHEHLSALVVGTSTLLHARLVAAPEGLATSQTLRFSADRVTSAELVGTFHDNRTKSVVFQAAFHWWDSGSRHQLLGGFPLPRGYPPASSPGSRRINADPWSAFRLSLLREPTARTGTNRFNVRATSRTMCCSNCQRSVCAYFQRKWAGRRSNPRLRCFKPPLDHLSYQPMLGCSGFARFGHEKRLDACVTPSLHKKAIRLKSECHMSSRYAGALPG